MFRVIPETATQIAELLSTGVDIIRAVPPDQIPAIEKLGVARVSATKILRVVFLQIRVSWAPGLPGRDRPRVTR